MTKEIAQQERLLGALCYWGTFVMSLIPACTLFMLKKEDSPFISKHALQAIFLNLLVFGLIWVGMSCVSNILGFLKLGIVGLLVLLFQVLVSLIGGIYILILGVQVFMGDSPEIPYFTDFMRQYVEMD